MTVRRSRLDLDLMFPHAMNALRGRLEKNEPRKKGKWKRQTLVNHLRHLSGHYNHMCENRSDDDHLAGVAIRAIMALEIRHLSHSDGQGLLTANGGSIQKKSEQS